MANFSNYAEEEILDHMFSGSTLDFSDLYMGLVSADASDGDLEGGDLSNEIEGYDGGRKPMSEGNFISATQEGGAGTVYNQDHIDFENMPADTVGYLILCDSGTHGGGNIIVWSPAATERTTNEGDTYRVLEEEFINKLD